MDLPGMQRKISALLREAVTVLCKNSLTYTHTFTVEGVLDVTLDCVQTFPIEINETVGDPSQVQVKPAMMGGAGGGHTASASTHVVTGKQAYLP